MFSLDIRSGLIFVVGVKLGECMGSLGSVSNGFSGILGFLHGKAHGLAMYFTLPLLSNGLSLDPANSNGLTGQPVGLPMESVGLDQILLLVQSKSSKSPVKSL